MKRQLLLVDDDPGLSWSIGRRLTRAGYQVTTCGDGEEAIEQLADKHYEVLITDIQMPRLNGLALIEWVVRNRPSLRVVAITAFGSPVVQQLAMKKGAILYLEKPFDPEVLVDLLGLETNRESFCGSVDGIDIFDYVQLVFVTMRELVLEVSSRSGQGFLFIKDGSCCHAVCGELTGIEAFYACMAFRGGTFRTLPWKPPEERTIEKGGDFLLMEAARMKDETGRISTVRGLEDASEKEADDPDLVFENER